MLINKMLFYCSIFIIFWAMIGYPKSLKFLDFIYKSKEILKNYQYQPTVTIMVVAYNEEKVILEKLENIIQLDYPHDKISFLVASDNSTDKTNEIVKKFIDSHKNFNIKLFEVENRKGKTNAQNEARKTVDTEYLIMTDANSILDRKAAKELMATFTSPDIAYVSGKLSIANQDASEISNAEASYWNKDLEVRDIEGRIHSITAGNGALYACRTTEYIEFNPIQSHDSAMPLKYTLDGKRAIANHDAIAYEKAGEVIEDEFGRKVRMNRVILQHILPDFRLLNVFKYRWYSYFYFGHRTCRYLLWLSHLILLISSILLMEHSWFYSFIFLSQMIFFILSLLKAVTTLENKYLTLIYYYTMTIVAQWVGVYRIITGKAKPFWEKAESTR